MKQFLRHGMGRVRAVCAALLFLPGIACAWGAEGHRLIAELAYERLPASTRERVQGLLSLEPGATLPSISTWADEVRSPSTAAWHYTNFAPGSGCRYVEEQDCPDGQCVVGALERQTQALSAATTPAEQLKALKWVVHLAGDLHQPLHAGIAGDKGGNLYQVQAFGRGTNLHAVWDGVLIRNWPCGLTALRSSYSPDAHHRLVSCKAFLLQSASVGYSSSRARSLRAACAVHAVGVHGCRCGSGGAEGADRAVTSLGADTAQRARSADSGHGSRSAACASRSTKRSLNGSARSSAQLLDGATPA